MLGIAYSNQFCSAARALEVVGERWSLLILRDILFRGTTRFSELEANLGLASNTLASRLAGFVDHGLLTRKAGPDTGSVRYRPTRKGLAFKPTIIALAEWGDRWAAPHGPPVEFKHRDCDGVVAIRMKCKRCDRRVAHADVLAVPRRRSKSRSRLRPAAGQPSA